MMMDTTDILRDKISERFAMLEMAIEEIVEVQKNE